MKAASVVSWCLALTVLLLVSAVGARADVRNVVPRGGIWKFLDNGSDQGTAWSGLDFNDAAWASGRAQLGYGDGDEVTVVSYGPDPNNKYITTSFYLRAGERGLVACVDHPDVTYDLYLPPGYSSTGPALPLLYTFHANGGGMVGDFQNVAANSQIILVGILESQNGVGWRDYIDVAHAVSRDLRQRVNYDPTAAFSAGWSGGAVASIRSSPGHAAIRRDKLS